MVAILEGSTTMKKIAAISSLALLALTMLLPVARSVNAATVNHTVFAQEGAPMPPPPPPGGGGH